MKIRDIGEFGLIDHIRHQPEIFNLHSAANFTGIGDDAAAINIIQGKKYLLWTADILIEGIHFLLRYPLFSGFRGFLRSGPLRTSQPSPAFMLGWKAMAVNLSDIAAMGGVARYALVTLGLKGNEDIKFIDDLYRGINAVGRKYRGKIYSANSTVEITGGDISKSPVLLIDISVLGEVEKENLILRRGARPGDVLCTTGFCGDSAAGLSLLKRRDNFYRICSSGLKNSCPESFCSSIRYLISRHLMPVPRIKESRVIAGLHLATAMIDSSDGLLVSVYFICQESGVGARIYEDRIPVSSQLRTAVRFMQKCGWNAHSALKNFVLNGGEDYELVFTVPSSKLSYALSKISGLTGTPVSAIGEITKDRKIYVVDSKGKKQIVNKTGFEHF